MRNSILSFKKKSQYTLFVILGLFLAALGLEGFLLPTHFIDGGVTGLAMLSSQYFNQPLPLMIILINLPFVIIGFKRFSVQFAITSALSIFALAALLHIFNFPVVTQDKLLAAVFGGLFLGAGIGFTIRGNSVLDGTEIVALILNQKFYINVGDIILVFNTIIFSLAAIFLGLEAMMYSIITYFAASKTADFIIHGLDEHIGLLIISKKSNQIKPAIINPVKISIIGVALIKILVIFIFLAIISSITLFAFSLS